jgi:hypothetical protein
MPGTFLLGLAHMLAPTHVEIAACMCWLTVNVGAAPVRLLAASEATFAEPEAIKFNIRWLDALPLHAL